MKKLITLILVLVLAVSLSTTAFASNPTPPEPTMGAQTSITGNSGATKVTMAVNDANLSVTVPISMTIVAPVAGGDCTVPTTYAIVNKSAIAVKVTEIQVTDKADGLTFSNTAVTTAIADKDKVSIKLTPSGQTGLQLSTDAITTGLGGFDIVAASTADGTSLSIAIEAKSGMLTSTTEQADAFTITFTVAAGATT